MNSIWGYGGVEFHPSTGTTAKFTGGGNNTSVADAVITYIPIFIRKENIDRKIIEKFLGYRVEVEVEILNILDNDATHFGYLLTALNGLNDGTKTLSLIVNTDPQGGSGIQITDVALTSDVSFEQIHKLEIGQTIKLKFAKKELMPSMSTYARGDTDSEWQFDGEGDVLIWDGSGDTIMIR